MKIVEVVAFFNLFSGLITPFFLTRFGRTGEPTSFDWEDLEPPTFLDGDDTPDLLTVTTVEVEGGDEDEEEEEDETAFSWTCFATSATSIGGPPPEGIVT